MDGVANNLYVVLKQISKFNGKKAGESLEWSSKLRASHSIYNKAIFNILQVQERPSETDAGQPPPVRRGMPLNPFSVFFILTGGSAFFMVRGFEGTTPEDGAGHRQLAWQRCSKFQMEFVRRDSPGAYQDEQHANALRTGPRRVPPHHRPLSRLPLHVRPSRGSDRPIIRRHFTPSCSTGMQGHSSSSSGERERRPYRYSTYDGDDLRR